MDRDLALEHHAAQLLVVLARLDLQRRARVALEVAHLLRGRVGPRPQPRPGLARRRSRSTYHSGIRCGQPRGPSVAQVTVRSSARNAADLGVAHPDLLAAAHRRAPWLSDGPIATRGRCRVSTAIGDKPARRRGKSEIWNYAFSHAHPLGSDERRARTSAPRARGHSHRQWTPLGACAGRRGRQLDARDRRRAGRPAGCASRCCVHASPASAPACSTAICSGWRTRGLITRSRYREMPPRVEIELTDAGRELLPVAAALSRWGLAARLERPRGEDERVDVEALLRQRAADARPADRRCPTPRSSSL